MQSRATSILLSLLAVGLLATAAWAATPASPAGDNAELRLAKPHFEPVDATKDVGDPVDMASALALGAGYLRHAQADITEDNAGNGAGAGEVPDDPDDGGWDWVATSPDFFHSTAASPLNTYGATVQGLLQAWLTTGDAALATAMDDAAATIIANPSIRTAADLIFLMRYDDLPYVDGTTYADAARAKYDGRVASYGSAAALAVYLRDLRGISHGNPNGIIGWDVGAFAVAAAMLDARYPGNGYGSDADAVAEVLWQDSFNHNPGLFDFQADKGYDPTYSNVNFYMYNLGVSGLLEAFVASGNHTDEVPALVERLLESQGSGGAVSYQYGAYSGDEDWQTTAYAALSLVATDQVSHQRAINKMGYWIGATQDVGSGGWVYGDGSHYTELGGECTAALSYAMAPSDAIVDDGFASQADVDVYNLANLTDFVFGYDAFNNVQDAVDAVSGTTVTVLPGTYVEQVVISQNMTLKGTGPASAASTIIRAPAAIPVAWGDRKAVVYVHDANEVYLRDLTVDGDGTGNTNHKLIGIGYSNAGGGIYGCTVTKVRHTPLNGAQGGTAIYLLNDDGTPRTMDVHDCVVNDFQKNGMALNAPNDQLVADVRNNQVTGAGILTYDNGDPAQNGIQVWGSSITGDIANNTVTGIAYDNTNNPTKYVAVCVLDFYSGVDITDNTVSNAHVGVYKIDGYGHIDDNNIAIKKVGVSSWGVIGSDPPHIVTSPVDDPLAKGRVANKALLNVVADGNTVTFAGSDNSSTFGIEVDAGYGPDDLSFTATNNVISGFEVGIEFWMCPSSCGTGVLTYGAANHNVFSGNTHGVRSNFDYLTIDASCNWWGHISGPAAAPTNPGLGNAATGDIVFWPWLNAASGGNCTQFGSNNVSVADATVCLTPSTTCLSLPVTFNRVDTTASRGVSVTIQLSPELELCTGVPATSILMANGVGSWSNGFSNLAEQIVDNGGRSYTIDRAILGAPCGPTGGGVLFNVSVKPSGLVTTEAFGTVTVTAVDVRDCANAQLPGVPGAVGDVAINLSVPAALTGLVAVQDKSGNGSDGLTAINLSWTAVSGDADFIAIWRKGYGDYPEYNDGTGATPVGPVTLGGGWTLVNTIPATSTAFVDEPPTRDFWSYAAYVLDECGNTSPVSAITSGTLSYHLGDVADGGNNLVTNQDMSQLGFYYGNTGIPYHDPVRSALDVGPTTNSSVNGRPTTDSRLQFEDLMIFAMNFDQVSKIDPETRAAGTNAIALAPGTIGSVGSTFDVAIVMAADGRIQGLSVPLTWDATVVEPVDMRAGDLLAAFGSEAMILSPEPGTVDAALMGVRSQGIAGQGILATVTFRVVAEGDAKLGLGSITARDSANQPVVLNGAGNLPPVSLPSVSELRANVPNPFNPSTEFSFVLAKAGQVSLNVYTVRGELVRTLVDEQMAAGPHSLTWNGLDDQGRQAASGGYVVRFIAPDRTQSRHVTLLK